MSLKKQLTIDIEVNPKEVAFLFWNLDNLEQAEFFNYLADISISEHSNIFNSQMAELSASPNLSEAGRKVMQTIGEFSTR